MGRVFRRVVIFTDIQLLIAAAITGRALWCQPPPLLEADAEKFVLEAMGIEL